MLAIGGAPRTNLLSVSASDHPSWAANAATLAVARRLPDVIGVVERIENCSDSLILSSIKILGQMVTNFICRSTNVKLEVIL